MDFNNTVLISGAGFSANYGIPTTSMLTKHFNNFPASDATPKIIQDEISSQLKAFWKEVFGISSNDNLPSFEQHFTTLDLAANSGHNLGLKYSPSKIRAIQRLSIHRVFDVLDKKFRYSEDLVEPFLNKLFVGENNSIITTNWDIGIEKHYERLNNHYNYGLEIEPVHNHSLNYNRNGMEILKLHGSANWVYCDSCRRLFYFHPQHEGKGALHNWTFLEARDFTNLRGSSNQVSQKIDERPPSKCKKCHIELTSRIATFSFEKFLSFNHFQFIWNKALDKLRNAQTWIFIGYSLPEADYKLRQLLKIAELAGSRNDNFEIRVILGSKNSAASRYKSFFGNSIREISCAGFKSWWANAG